MDQRKQSTLLELCYEYSGDDINLEEKDWNEAKHLVKIFDNYACDFAYWLSNDWLLDEMWSKITEPKELLEIFKKQKGL